MSNGVLGVIPARYPSSRLPGKPLKDIGGKLLIQRVWEQACKAKCFTEVVIATDDERIRAVSSGFGATVLMTSANHETGSDRVCEAMQIFRSRGQEFEFVANVQGDMPFINPLVIDATANALGQAPSQFGMSTVATPIMSEEEFLRPSSVKVVLGNNQEALYFSRAPIPFWRERLDIQINEANPCGYKHMGLYFFRAEALERLAALEQSLPEKREKLEQLRALTGGIQIKVFVAGAELVRNQIEVDTPEDLERANKIARSLDFA